MFLLDGWSLFSLSRSFSLPLVFFLLSFSLPSSLFTLSFSLFYFLSISFFFFSFPPSLLPSLSPSPPLSLPPGAEPADDGRAPGRRPGRRHQAARQAGQDAALLPLQRQPGGHLRRWAPSPAAVGAAVTSTSRALSTRFYPKATYNKVQSSEGRETIYHCRCSKAVLGTNRTTIHRTTIARSTQSLFTTKTARIRCYTMLSNIL